MTDLEILAEMKAEILALSNDEIKRPSVPLFVSIYEAERLAIRASNDIEDLSVVNCSAEKIARLSKLASCARIASVSYDEIDGNITVLQQQWTEVDYPDAIEKRNALIGMCDLAFYGDTVLEAKVAEIKQGDSILDTIEDLSKLSVLGPDNAAKLTPFNFTVEPFLAAGELAVTLTRKRAVIDGNTYLDSDSKVLRDKSITLMQREVDYVRRCGKFVYRSNADKLKHYKSAYRHTKNLNRTNASDTNSPSEE